MTGKQFNEAFFDQFAVPAWMMDTKPKVTATEQMMAQQQASHAGFVGTHDSRPRQMLPGERVMRSVKSIPEIEGQSLEPASLPPMAADLRRRMVQENLQAMAGEVLSVPSDCELLYRLRPSVQYYFDYAARNMVFFLDGFFQIRKLNNPLPPHWADDDCKPPIMVIEKAGPCECPHCGRNMNKKPEPIVVNERRISLDEVP